LAYPSIRVLSARYSGCVNAYNFKIMITNPL
jgi:hypothetical protein